MFVQEKIILSFAEITLIKDRIICVDYLSEEPLNVDKGIEMVETIHKLNNYEPCAVIHNVGDRYIFTSDALRFMGSQLTTEDHKYLARALVTTNAAARIASNNFIKLYKPLVPTKLFTEVEKAITWVGEIITSGK
jgi:hypothetical protein